MYYWMMLSANAFSKIKFGIAYAPNWVNYETLENGKSPLGKWEIPVFKFEGLFSCLLANTIGWNLFSEDLKKIIEENKSEYDELKWFETIIYSGDLGKRTYYALHFIRILDILNKKKQFIQQRIRILSLLLILLKRR